MPKLTTIIHEKLASHVQQGDFVIDATLGNGHDSAFLAIKVGEGGQVFSFDIQENSITNSRELLTGANLIKRCTLKLSSHANMDKEIPEKYHSKISTVMFNIGYLPGSNKTITTNANSSIIACKKALTLLKPNGLISLIIYPGHSEGKIEAQKITEWINSLDKEYSYYYTQYQKEKDPIACIIKN